VAPNVTGIDGGSCEFDWHWHCASETSPNIRLSVDPSKSSTFKDILPGNFTATYGDGSKVTGDYFTDTLTILGATVNDLQVRL